MKNYIKAYWKTLLFFTFMGLVGGFFIGIYQLESYPAEIQQQLIEGVQATGLDQFPVAILLGIITAIQSAAYGLILGGIGIWLGKKIGLWKDEKNITRKPLMISIVISIVGGLSLILSDVLFFGNYSEAIMNSYAVKPSISYLIATVTYAAVIEEVVLRLFLMTLIAFILFKLFEKNKEKPSTKLLVVANIAAALLFAAGHLPGTAILLGLTPMIIFRCFLLNGVFGLMFGYLYRKYGLRYAMIAHGGCHVVSKLIWILFI